MPVGGSTTGWISLCLALAARPVFAGGAEELLARAKRAVGGERWDQVRALTYRTRFSEGGAVTIRESLVELAHGRYYAVERRPGGDAKEGFDGDLAWRQGRGLIGLEPDQKEARTAAYMKAHGYLFPGRWKVDARLLGTRTVEGVAVDAIGLQPEGGDTVELDLDAATHRPLSERYGSAAIVYEDYRDVSGLWLAHRARSAGFSAATEEAAVDPIYDEALFEIPRPRSPFADGVTTVGVAAKGAMVEAVVAGAGPFPFLLDSGGFAQLTPSLAGAVAPGAAPNTPVVADVRLGGLRLSSMTFLNSLGLGNVAASVFGGREKAGTLGVETFLSVVVRLEPAGRIVFFSKGAFSPPPGAAALPLSFELGKPVVEGSLDGRPARFILDTGSNAELVLFPDYVEKSGLGRRTPAGTSVKTIYGFFTLAGTSTRVSDVAIGPIRLKEAGAILVSGKVRGAPDVAGLVGMGILGRRAVTFDYRGHRVYLEP